MKNKEFYISEMLDVSAAVIHANANSNLDHYFVIEVSKSGATFYHLYKNECVKKFFTRSWSPIQIHYLEFADFKPTVQTYLDSLVIKDLQMTAVEELQFAAEQDKIDLSDYMPLVNRIFEEQIIEAYNQGVDNADYMQSAEQYYEMTYGKGI